MSNSMSEEETITDPPPRQPVSTDAVLEKLAARFELSARRWEMVVYPALFMFIILAAYGFYLIYSLTEDMHTLARSMDSNMSDNMQTMSDSIETMALNVASMTDRITEIGLNMEHMADNTDSMDTHLSHMLVDMNSISFKLDNLDPIVRAMSNMDQSMRAVTSNTSYMTQDVNSMSRSIKPMNFMNNFMPW
jgi:uncharacterized protein YoxC